MSRKSDAKKARRRKRQAGRDARWLPDGLLEEIVDGDAYEDDDGDDDDGDDELVLAAQKFGEWVGSRGWTFDVQFSGNGLASWYYGPSATEFDDERLEPVTRIWFTLNEFPHRVSAALVGTGGGEGAVYAVSPEQLLEGIGAIEAYRPGDTAPVLA